ncbi:double-strand break repair protein AddB [Actibacterium sp. 188UL27-1]|uniref:double-strand break repair protein AddB n=1 Tax=Actibacterium sp. 188UL27-1 TaxID=2786961 RepID=UPI001955FA73|nr:double-strand break repair protein AddB [Actibacterium sp. 188UL27-1]MBM7067231.1 double-strand break repair protein AddB [Actibacterium sp. 188UL27-1]
MFDTPGPRMFGTAPGVDFPRAVIAGLEHRLAGAPPVAWARVTLYVNTRRMQRRILDLLAAGPPRLLPQIRLITTPDDGPIGAAIPTPLPPLQVRLELRQLLARLMDAQPELAPRSALFDLADSLAALMDEMQGEGAAPETLHRLDVADHASHWGRSLTILSIVTNYLKTLDRPFGSDARLRQVTQALQRHWATYPPQDPVLIAGSTGSRGATRLLMEAVAHLPQGALILPGYDFDQQPDIWSELDDPKTGEDHPQYRFRHLMRTLKLGPTDVRKWAEITPPHPACNRLISLALRPAPVTDQWRAQSRTLTDLTGTTAHMTLVQAPTPREEAATIALCLRQALAQGKTAALITPDRMLTRQVTAALDRWAITPDDSAGRPLNQSAPGRFLRHVGAAMAKPLRLDHVLTLLKHPLTCSTDQRGDHLRWTRELELFLRREGYAFPNPAHTAAWLAKVDHPPTAWADWLDQTLLTGETPGDRDLSDHLTDHLELAERIAGGPSATSSGALWKETAGEAAQTTVNDLQGSAAHGGRMSHRDYLTLFSGVLAGKEVREAQLSHPDVMIWGTLEARVQGADLVILGGLNDGVWPELPSPDPWLNRTMRLDAGLLLPERRVGLSAHDFQQAISAQEVILSRALRDDEAETIPSRWLNRLGNLLRGTSDEGQAAFAAMERRGADLMHLARTLDQPTAQIIPAGRPSPCPPAEARPRELPVTAISTLIRDPYAVYARHVLRLYPLDPVLPEPDARLRGTLLHRVMGGVIREGHALPTDPAIAQSALLQSMAQVLHQDVPWPAMAYLWQAKFRAVLPDIVARETPRATHGIPVLEERRGQVALPGLDFTLTAKPDRIDQRRDGTFAIYDYKSGKPPSQKEVEAFDKQLTLEAAMLVRGGFKDLGPGQISELAYIALGNSDTDRPIILDGKDGTYLPDTTWEGLHRLIIHYHSETKGFTARRAVQTTRFEGDYDHLSRLGEWSDTDPPKAEDVGR